MLSASRGRLSLYRLKSAPVASSVSDRIVLPAAVPKTVTGTVLHDPIRSILLQAARERGQSKHLWATTGQLNAAKLQLRNDARPVEVPVTDGVRVSFWSIDDVIFPHNVSVWCLAGSASARVLWGHRTVCGGFFPREICSRFQCATQRRGLVSKCWVSEAECQLLSWTPLPSAAPEAVDRSAAIYFNTQDIRETVDFSRYFTHDRRMYSVSTGRLLNSLWTLRLRLQQDSATSPAERVAPNGADGGIALALKDTFVHLTADDVADTELNLMRAAGDHNGAPLQFLGTPLTVVTQAEDVLQLFTASQTSQPDSILRYAQAKREKHLQNFRQLPRRVPNDGSSVV